VRTLGSSINSILSRLICPSTTLQVVKADGADEWTDAQDLDEEWRNQQQYYESEMHQVWMTLCMIEIHVLLKV
jgi:hypothetical protein